MVYFIGPFLYILLKMIFEVKIIILVFSSVTLFCEHSSIHLIQQIDHNPSDAALFVRRRMIYGKYYTKSKSNVRTIPNSPGQCFSRFPGIPTGIGSLTTNGRCIANFFPLSYKKNGIYDFPVACNMWSIFPCKLLLNPVTHARRLHTFRIRPNFPYKNQIRIKSLKYLKWGAEFIRQNPLKSLFFHSFRAKHDAGKSISRKYIISYALLFCSCLAFLNFLFRFSCTL